MKGTCFLTSIMNFMQFMYMYSEAYLSIRAGWVREQYFVDGFGDLEFRVAD